MSNAGVEVVIAVENDHDAATSFRLNHLKARVIERDIRAIRPAELLPEVQAIRDSGGFLVFAACTPCQPFSKQRRGSGHDDPRSYLLREFLRFVSALRPDFVFCENVPEAREWAGAKGSPAVDLMRVLDSLGYHFAEKIVDCRDYGVPQRRARWILMASSHGMLSWPRRTHGPDRNRAWTGVREWIAGLPPLRAGEVWATDPVHRAARLSRLNLRRIRSTPVGGSRLDWPDRLVLECHRRSPRSFTDVYGRLRMDEPASAITTRCISLSSGRFGHPDQDRAISLREAACIQTFPRDYLLVGNLESIAAQVGNAVPVLLAERFGRRFVDAVRRSR